LREGDAGIIVNGHVQIFPTAMMFAAATAIGAHHHFGKTAQVLDVEMQQIAGSGMFVADHRGDGVEIALTI
jgi:hypothetical protein